MKSSRLICTACGKEFSDERFRCECGEPLEVVIEVKRTVKIQFHRSGILESFSDLLPGLEDKNSLSLGEGFTPLTRLGDKDSSGMELYAKNESINPTWSFKDRGSYLAVLDAIGRGYNHIGTVSTGNMAASVAAFGKRAGLETTILVSDSIPDEKLSPISIYGSRVIKVKGDYGQLYYDSLEAGKNSGIYFANSDAPMRVEGSKTIAFEIFIQLGERVPDFVIVPTSSGGNVRGIEKGFRELRDSKLSVSIPRMIVAQAAGCSPIDLAFSSRASTITRFHNPKTIAHAIENPFPPSGNAVLRMLKRNGGATVAIDESSILKAQKSLANNGLFVQPASAVAYAAISKLREEIDMRKALVVVVLTGSGLKYPAILKEHPSFIESTSLEFLEEILKGNQNFID